MADENVQIKWTADFSDIDSALQRVQASANESFQAVGNAAGEAAASVRTHAENIKEETTNIGESLNSLKKTMTTAFEAAGIMAAYEAIEHVKEALDESAERAEKIKQLSEIMGTTTKEMQGLQAVAEETGVGADMLQRGLMKVTQMMTMARDGSKEDTEALAKVGISAADLSDKSFSAANALYAIANSGAQAGDVQYVLGQRAGLLAAAFDKLRGGQKAMEAEATRLHGLNAAEIDTLTEYKDKVATLGVEWENLKGHVAAYLVTASGPMVDSLKGIFSGMGDVVDISVILKGAFALVATAIIAVADAFKTVKDIIVANVQVITTAVVALGQAIWDALHGRMAAAKADIQTAYESIKETIASAGHAVVADNEESAQAVEKTWKAALAGVKDSGKPEERTQVGGGGTGAGAAAAQAAALKAQQEAMRATAKVSQDERQAAKAAMAEANKDLAEMVSEAKTQYKSQLDARLSNLDQEESAVKQAAAEHLIGPTEELAQLRTILQEKYQAQLDYYNKLKALAVGNGAQTTKIDADMQRANQQYTKGLGSVQSTVTKQIYDDWNKTATKVGNSWSQSINKMLSGTMTLGQLFRQTAQKMVENWISMGTQMVTHTLAAEGAKQAAMRATGQVQTATAQQAGTQSLLQSGTTALKSIMNNAYNAASGAFNAMVGIPYVGPIIAPAAAAAAFAAVAAFQGGIASAAGGWEVPGDQLAMVHKNEMILPANISSGLKGLIGGGGSGGVTHSHTWNVSAIDAQSFAAALNNNKSALASTINGIFRQRTTKMGGL